MSRSHDRPYLDLTSRGAAGQLQDALVFYKKSKECGVEKAAVHIRNVSILDARARPPLHLEQVSAKIFGQQLKDAEKSSNSK